MKRILMLILAAVMVAGMAGCGAETTNDNAAEEAKAAFSGLMDAIKNTDAEKLVLYSDNADAQAEESIDVAAEADESSAVIFSKMQYNIISAKRESSEKVTIVADIHTIDLTGVMGQCTMQVMNEYVNELITEDQMESRAAELFAEECKKENLPMVVNQVTVVVNKRADGWKVEMSDEFKNAVFGGLLQRIESATPAM